MDYVAFGLILDEVAFPDGRVASGLLGGGGPQTAFGMRLWADRVGLVARVGPDLPGSAWDWLDRSEIDTAGIQMTDVPTLRARQQLEARGGRRHAWQVPPAVVGRQLARSLADLPDSYRRARGWHTGLHPESPDLGFLAGLRALGGQVSIEPFRPAVHPLPPPALRDLLGAGQVFSPNAAEARSLVGEGEPAELVRRLLRAGAQVVALRLGEAGSLVARAGLAARHVPALPVTVADPVGAGNAYCGGFLVGWVETGDLTEAGLRGAVAASFVLEQLGTPAATVEVRQAARERLAALRAVAG